VTTPPALSQNEPLRLDAVRSLQLIDTPLEERFERLTRLAKALLHVDVAALSLVDSDRQFFKSIQGVDLCETSRDISFCGHSILGEDLFYVPDARLDDRFARNPLVIGPPHIVSYASIPVRSPDGHNVGTLCAIHSARREFDSAELQHLRDLAALAELELRTAASGAVQSALVEEVSFERRKSMVDPLTRLWNREAIENIAEEALSRAADAERGCAIAMIDLDDFKQINDSSGHVVGDEILQTVAKRMLSALGETDAIGRFGDDEFLCVLPECATAEQSLDAAERLRERLIEGRVRTQAGPKHVMASIGVEFVEPGRHPTLQDVIHAADTAMYACKHAGQDGILLQSNDKRAA